MKRIVAAWPAEPRTKDAGQVALVYAGVLVLGTAALLFKFDEVLPFFEASSFGYYGGRALITILATAGVFALPFLLRMKVSIGFRWFSMGLSWLVPLLWGVIAVHLNAQGVTSVEVSSSISVQLGWWMLPLVGATGLLAAWASWGLWPGKRATHAPLEHRRKK